MKVLLEKMCNGYLRRWNLTINRKEEVMKNIKRLTVLSALIFSTVITASWFDSGEDKKQEIAKSVTIEKIAKDCEIPAFAKAIGHEDKWLLHNGCPPRKDAKKNEAK
jgi:hypothetical protein